MLVYRPPGGSRERRQSCAPAREALYLPPMRRSPGAGSSLAAKALWMLPEEPLRGVVRRWRGRREAQALRASDVVFVSYGKSGRTWLRLMLSRFFQQRFGLEEGVFLEFDNLHRQNAAIPKVYFTHGNYLPDYTGHPDVFEDFADRRVVLLIRDPRDVAVSQYFQWGRRMRPHKKWLNRYPEHGAELSLFEFVHDHESGLTRVIEFQNRWAEAFARLDQLLLIHYEEMRARPEGALQQTLEFMGFSPSAEELKDGVAYAAFDNMRKLEEDGSVRASGQRLVPGQHGDWDSYKVRRAVVGGYRDYLDATQRAAIDARLAAELNPAFGYADPQAESDVTPR